MENSVKTTRKAGNFIITDKAQFKGFVKGDKITYQNYSIEVMDSYPDPKKVDQLGRRLRGCKTIFAVTINGKAVEGDIEKLRRLVGAQLSEGEGQKSTHRKGLTKVKNLLTEAFNASENERVQNYIEEVIRIVEQEEQREAERRAEEARIAEEKKEAEAKLKNLKARAQKMIAEGNFEEAMRLLERLK